MQDIIKIHFEYAVGAFTPVNSVVRDLSQFIKGKLTTPAVLTEVLMYTKCLRKFMHTAKEMIAERNCILQKIWDLHIQFYQRGNKKL